MKVVFDTNIWVSAIIWGGIPDRILLLGETQSITISMSQELLNELERTFSKSKLQPKLQALDLTVSSVMNLIRESVIVYPIDEITVPNLRDPDDNIVVATAIAAQADVMITGDRDLLVLETYQGISIMTAKDFLQSLETGDFQEK
ncbi:putative toxin-antitoxin system toxin component, PIN family [Roseofilum capinflatum]|uniref:Toxin-antitoxin system toxin component, PIN family n=1 Tax=Roseofilum capinflatum BLCC-M114 TaxID=3022440 RepID=A0ABT7B1C2_9CYAN|nr:putative toxin-antitoxin system toxin component, PIN family [Roseofilum capinflatum]MDJ1172964.1 putative toxin-antitoxin system toxin component, PIN family [Roseofilum capinflatum BLCC-M114]